MKYFCKFIRVTVDTRQIINRDETENFVSIVQILTQQSMLKYSHSENQDESLRLYLFVLFIYLLPLSRTCDDKSFPKNAECSSSYTTHIYSSSLFCISIHSLHGDTAKRHIRRHFAYTSLWKLRNIQTRISQEHRLYTDLVFFCFRKKQKIDGTCGSWIVYRF